MPSPSQRHISLPLLTLCAVATLAGCDRAGTRYPREAAPEAGKCVDFEKDVERVWSKERRTEVKAAMLKFTGERTKVYRDQVITQMDNVTRDWVYMQESICKDTLEREVMSAEVYVKISACLRTVLVSQRTVVETLAAPTAEPFFNASTVIRDIRQTAADCQNEAIYSFYANSDDDLVAEARTLLARSETLTALKSDQADLAFEKATAAAARTDDEAVKLQALYDQAVRAYDDARFGEARTLSEQVVRDAERLGNWMMIARGHNLIGLVLGQLGAFAEARASHERALAIRRRVFGDDHPETAVSRSNLGTNLALQGRDGEALPLMLEATRVFLRPGQEERLANGYGELSEVYGALGDLEQALKYAQQSLDLRRRLHGEEHPQTGTAYLILSGAYGSRGDVARALDLAQRGVAILERSLGDQNLWTATGYSNLSSAYADTGDASRALEFAQKFRDIIRQTLGAQHPRMAVANLSISTSLVRLGRLDEATSLIERGLDLNVKIFGERHPITANAYWQLGDVAFARGEWATALRQFRTAREIYVQIYGDTHRHVLSLSLSIAGTLANLANTAEALSMAQQVLETRRRTLGEDHPDTAASHALIAHVHHAAGDFAAAAAARARAVEIFVHNYGETHPTVADHLCNLGLDHYNLEDGAAARDAFQRCVDIRTDLNDELGAASALISLAHTTDYLLDETPTALPLFQQALDIRTRVLGEDHPETRAIRDNIQFLCTEREYKPACEGN